MATTCPPLTVADVLAMTKEDLRIECLRLEIPASGLDKTAIQRQLLGNVVARATTTLASQTRASPVYAAVKTDPLGPDQEGRNLEDPNKEESAQEQEDLETQDHDLQKTQACTPTSPGRFHSPSWGCPEYCPCRPELRDDPVPAELTPQAETKPPAQSWTMSQYSDVSDIQLQLRRLELEHAREEREREWEREREEREREREERERERRREERTQQLEHNKLELQQEERQRERQQQLELKKLELEMSRASDPSAQSTDPLSFRPPLFRVEAAVKLVPKFSENDVQTFLISFEKVAD